MRQLERCDIRSRRIADLRVGRMARGTPGRSRSCRGRGPGAPHLHRRRPGGRLRRTGDRRGRRLRARCRRGRCSDRGRGGRGRSDHCQSVVCSRRRRFGGNSRRRAPRWEQRQRVDISLRVGRVANAEVDVWNVELRDTTRPDRPHGRAFLHRGVLLHRDRTEVEERHGVAVAGLDGDSLPVGWNGSRERHRAARRRSHRCPSRRADVDAAMLSRRVGIGAKAESAEDGAVDRPAPPQGCGWENKRDHHRRKHASAHTRTPPSCQVANVFDASSPAAPLPESATVSLRIRERCVV